MTILESDRLILRQFQWEDLDALAALMSEARVMRFIGNGSTKTREQIQRLLGFWIADSRREWDQATLARLPQLQHAIDHDGHFSLWAAVHKKDRKLIGRIGLLAWNLDGRHETEVGYMIAPKYWGQGLATEGASATRDYAFERLKLERLISLVHPDNLPSQRVAMRNGMTHERNTKLGEITARVYAINKAHWESLKNLTASAALAGGSAS